MAVPNTLIVSNAGYAPANGTYTRVADLGGYPVWEQAGGAVVILIATGGPTVFWQITGWPQVGGGPACNIIYSSNFDIPGANWPGEYPGDPAADPITWSNDCLGTGNAPVVSIPAPDPYAPWGGFANWQRLRLLEYV